MHLCDIELAMDSHIISCLYMELCKIIIDSMSSFIFKAKGRPQKKNTINVLEFFIRELFGWGAARVKTMRQK